MLRLLLLWAACWPAALMAQQLDSLHIMVDADAATAAGQPFTYATFQDAAAHFTDGVTVYIRPGVYWIDDPDDPAVRVGKDGREPFGMTVRCPRLHLMGLGGSAADVVLASQRGQTQGAVGNFTMFDFWVRVLKVENLTMGNYCNVDLVYPRNPALNRRRRSDAITQAHVGYVHGDSLVAKNVRFISRLNLNPLNGARHSYYEDCHFECTDDALNGTATYRHCDFDLYGQKPFWSTFGRGALFIDCDFYVKSHNRDMYFTKQGGPVTVVSCRYHAPTDSVYVGWTAYPQPWLRCYQQDFTLNGKPYDIGRRHPGNTVVLSGFNGTEPPFVGVEPHSVSLQDGRDSIRLVASAAGVSWRVAPVHAPYVSLRDDGGGAVTVLPVNATDEAARFCLTAVTPEGFEGACHLTVLPSELPPPAFRRAPRIKVQRGVARLDYQLDLQGCREESDITWLRDGIPVSVSHAAPQRTYALTAADVGHRLGARIAPKSHRSAFGQEREVSLKPAISAKQVLDGRTLVTDFHDFPCQWQPAVKEGFWTVDGYKPLDTAEFPWGFDRQKPMWEYKEGFNGAVGMGLLQAQRGARLMYTPQERTYGDMTLTLLVDPTKTAGQGFGSATGQYMDVCLKFDTRSLTGYGLRIIRTTKHAKAVDFLLVTYDHGIVTPLTAPVSSTCYRTGCTISVGFNGNQLTATVTTQSPKPQDSSLPHAVSLSAAVSPNPYGGLHIQHTGSCGESTTMIHSLTADWK